MSVMVQIMAQSATQQGVMPQGGEQPQGGGAQAIDNSVSQSSGAGQSEAPLNSMSLTETSGSGSSGLGGISDETMAMQEAFGDMMQQMILETLIRIFSDVMDMGASERGTNGDDDKSFGGGNDAILKTINQLSMGSLSTSVSGAEGSSGGEWGGSGDAMGGIQGGGGSPQNLQMNLYSQINQAVQPEGASLLNFSV